MYLPEIKFECENKDIELTMEYIHNYWKKLITESPPYTKNGLFYLPYPYVVPGGVFQQLFYWDSYFIILGLKVSKAHELIKKIVENFLYEMKTFGIIPNSSEIAHLSRSQPPLLTSMIEEAWDGDKEWLRNAYEAAKIEYREVWMNPKTHYNEKIGLNKYYDDLEGMLRVQGEAYLYFDKINIPIEFWQERTEAESGWDYTDRFYRQCGFFIPVDLNALLYKYEVDFSKFAEILGLKDEVDDWKQKALQRKNLMNQYLWNETYGVYFDFNFINYRQYFYHSLATFYPLWVGAASSEQANRVVRSIPLFLHRGGMVTSTVKSGHQWDYPNGWAPLQWIVIKALQNYGFEKESIKIAKRWIHLCTDMFMKYSKLYEKYNVVDFNIDTVGRYPLQEGFGWTNGVYEKIVVDILGCKIERASNRQNNTIKLGFIAPLAGDEAIYGQPAKNGFELAVERYNEQGGILGKQIEWIVYDDKGDSTEAINAFEKLVKDDKVDAVIGGILSSEALAIAPLSAKYNLPIIVPSAAYADITKGYNTVFRTATTSPLHGRALAQFAYDILSSRKASVIYDAANKYAAEVADAFKNAFETKGGIIVSDEAYAEGTQNFTPFLSRIKENNPDVILISDYTKPASIIVKQLKEAGINVTLLGGGGWEGWQKIEDGNRIFEGGYFVQQYAVDEPTSENKNFITAYRRKYNENPDALAALGYDAAVVMLEAMRKAGTTETETVLDWLEATNLQGVTGEIKFDRQHNALKPMYIFKIQNGKNILVQKIRVE